MATCSYGSPQRTPFSHKLQHLNHSLSTSLKPLLRNLQHSFPLLKIDAPMKRIEEASVKLLDAFVDRMFEFVDEPLLPSQSNFAPVEEIGGPIIHVATIQGKIPDDFPEGVYIRNGSNPMFGGFKSAVSAFGKTSRVWIEGEGMLHAVYFNKDSTGQWTSTYSNRYVETKSFLLEKERNRPCFLPAVEGDPRAVLSCILLNMLRFGMPNTVLSNTNIFEHAGKFYSVAENYVPQEIDISTLRTLGDWDVNGAWTRPFTSHPKIAPGTGELVTIGVDGQKPYFELGVISADGTRLIHRVDLKLKRSTLCHEIGVTERFNVIPDFPLIVDLKRVIRGGSLIQFEKTGYSRIGVMPRYGDANSIQWFQVETSCVFHILNCFEDGDEVVVMACRALESIIPGPDLGRNKREWFSRGLKHINLVEEDTGDGMLFSRPYEWRLNMKTGEVKERNLTGTEFSMDFPMINARFTGVKNKYAYTQLVDSVASTTAGMTKYGGLAKLHLEERNVEESEEEMVKFEYHMFPKSTYCTGATFVAKHGAVEEDDGWIITYVHNEDTDTSQVYIVDAKQFSREPVAKIALPTRVPYGFHGFFAPTESMPNEISNETQI